MKVMKMKMTWLEAMKIKHVFQKHCLIKCVVFGIAIPASVNLFHFLQVKQDIPYMRRK